MVRGGRDLTSCTLVPLVLFSLGSRSFGRRGGMKMSRGRRESQIRAVKRRLVFAPSWTRLKLFAASPRHFFKLEYFSERLTSLLFLLRLSPRSHRGLLKHLESSIPVSIIKPSDADASGRSSAPPLMLAAAPSDPYPSSLPRHVCLLTSI